jgi:hypothetical protein
LSQNRDKISASILPQTSLTRIFSLFLLLIAAHQAFLDDATWHQFCIDPAALWDGVATREIIRC